jgi:hypothetical protein
VFHDFDPAKAHKSQFLHPILRYYAPEVQSNADGGETAAHHVLEYAHACGSGCCAFALDSSEVTARCGPFSQVALSLLLPGRDTYTNFSNPTLHVAPMSKFLERFRTKPLLKADARLGTRWAEVAPRQHSATDFQPGTTKTRRHHRGHGVEWKETTTDGRPRSTAETNESSETNRASPDTLKARELKDLLRARNLDTRGTKAQLVSRLEEAYKLEL